MGEMDEVGTSLAKTKAGTAPIIALFGAIHLPNAAEKLLTLVASLEEVGFAIYYEEALAQALADIGNPVSVSHTFGDETPQETKFVISFGGDGTFLRSLHRLPSSDTPILPINSGHLGFLTEVSPQQAVAEIPLITEEKYSLEERPLIALYNSGGELLGNAFNEIAIERSHSGSLITVDAWINGDFLAKYRGNGLLLATPSGSTAYSLSLGGPIVDPRSEVVLLTPIAPHTLNLRPMVVPNHVNITLKVSARNDSYDVIIDGRITTLPISETLSARLSDTTIKILKLSEQSFADVVRSKLLWGEMGTSR